MAELLEPREYNVSVKRAEAVSIFEEHRTVSMEDARRAVKKAGFKYLGAEIVARGTLKWAGEPGESDLLLSDTRANMTARLGPSDTDSIHQSLVDEFRAGQLADTVQVNGTIIAPQNDRNRPKELGTSFSIIITDWSPGGSAKLPPLVRDKKGEPSGATSDDGWF